MVIVQDDVDLFGMACEVLVDGVIHHFPNTVVQSRTIMGVAKVHPRPFSNSFKSFENLNASCIVIFCHKFIKSSQNSVAVGRFASSRLRLPSNC
jgi:hypothetical protein